MRNFFYFLLTAVTVVLAACGDDNAPVIYDNGALPGKFSVDDKGTQVQFSRGNLQYRDSIATWRFATNQWDFVGDAKQGTVSEAGEKSDNEKIDRDYTGWIDLFGWGTGNNPTESSTNIDNYSVSVDWGTNTISNGGNTPNIWRTLTKDEWAYLFCGRTNAAKLFSLGKVNGVNGTILLPDNWAGAKFDNAADGLVDKGSYYYNSKETNFTLHTYDGDTWNAMERAGAVFLPAAGDRYGKVVRQIGAYGHYWSVSSNDIFSACILSFDSVYLELKGSFYRRYGSSVRLVR